MTVMLDAFSEKFRGGGQNVLLGGGGNAPSCHPLATGVRVASGYGQRIRPGSISELRIGLRLGFVTCNSSRFDGLSQWRTQTHARASRLKRRCVLP